jgi:CDP-glucose 4,6-dehydratase
VGTLNMKQALASFAGRRVFVTGHTGFKGSWLSLLLTLAGAEVMGYALAPITTPNHFDMLGLAGKMHHVVGDVTDGASIREALTDFQPEYVFHLAAQALVKHSYDDPTGTFATNVIGSVNLLDAVRHVEAVRSLVYVTSDKCYENVEWIWGYRENDRLGGHDPYSASKAAAEILFSAFARSFFSSRPQLGAASTRAGNVIGGGDWSRDRIIPDCVRSIEAGQPIYLRNPSATRPWQHVLEPLSGYLQLAAGLREDPEGFAGAWNFGPNSSEVRTVRDVARAMVDRLGRGSIEVGVASPAHHEAQLLQLNCDKAHQLLGWKPRWCVDKTLEATADWYVAWMSGQDMRVVSEAQIHDYFPELT